MTTSSEKKTFTLLSEIFSLIAKYGEENFYNAISKLNDPELVKSLNQVKSAAITRKQSVKSSKHIVSTSKKPTDMLNIDLVNNIKNHLSNIRVFKETKDVRSYLENQKFVNPDLLNKRSRQQMISTFCKQCSYLTTETLELVISELERKPLHGHTHKDDRSLENWSDIILKKDNKANDI
ncbi:hypothetical protein ACJQTL_001426 [Escherichia coli]|uniref:hypothetical protein n=1 Tax=Escherichia coli TaxID=562 RepID=UPI000541E40A|nr:hypothetical protein [Escherichia coli]HDQ6634869.1 hypothetical protein [Escherichia coli O76:H7]EEY8044765.1 hypothetical protein [Escherichia coli]EEZ0863537.1 hypothetical protein [Escherichia coli]EEZ1904934.1 hypothetical protein [Escherichia coli]EFC1163832.1 hypothetical protein [Escherichia coli]